MQIYLTSTAVNVLDKIIPLIRKDPYKIKVAFIPTAGNVYESTPWIDEDRKKLVSLGCTIFDVDLANVSKEELPILLQKSDIIFVAGGNTFYLLEKAIKSGFEFFVKKLVSTDKIYIGSSAGSIILGPDISFAKVFDDPTVAQLDSTKGFGLIDFIPLPHYKKGNPKYEQVINEYGNKYKLIPLTDKQYIIADAKGFRVESS